MYSVDALIRRPISGDKTNECPFRWTILELVMGSVYKFNDLSMLLVLAEAVFVDN
jgi:hypothetical protein